ncbi:MAG: hypothetical protein AABY84_00595, partial [Candidatus Firestonebacteria bacterium]
LAMHSKLPMCANCLPSNYKKINKILFLTFKMIAKIKAVDKTMFLVFILAFLIRILYNIFFYVGINDVPTSDAEEYHEIAI